MSYWILGRLLFNRSNPEQGGKNGDHSATTISCKWCFDNASLYDYDGTLNYR